MRTNFKMLELDLTLCREELDRYRAKVNKLKTSRDLGAQKLHALTQDYYSLQDEMRKAYSHEILLIDRLSQAKPSDEMSELNLVNRDLESLLNGLTAQRKRTMKHIDHMARLVDFETMSKVKELT